VWQQGAAVRRLGDRLQHRVDAPRIAAILERPVIDKILTHLGLQTRAPPGSPARG